jgi:hypothetical protein
MGLIFGIGPMFLFLVYINPATVRISNFEERVQVQLTGAHVISQAAVGASELELTRLEEIKNNTLARIKKIDSRESLLRFSGVLADGLTLQARSCGLRVLEVDFQNTLIKGGYQPVNEHALDALNELSKIEWMDMGNPLDLPMLKLPFIEIQMNVGPGYSEVLSFIDSLPEFPTQVNLVELATTDESHGRGFRLKIRGYYFSAARKSEPS